MGKLTWLEIGVEIESKLQGYNVPTVAVEDAARAVLALLERKAGEAEDDTVDCEECAGPRTRCAAVNASGVRCDKPATRHSYHRGGGCGWPESKPDPVPVASAADILAIACPHCRAPAGQTCNGGGLVCAARIRAARKDDRP